VNGAIGWRSELPVDNPRDRFVDASYQKSSPISHQHWWLQKFSEAYVQQGGFLSTLAVRMFVWRRGHAFYEQMFHRDPRTVAAEHLKRGRPG